VTLKAKHQSAAMSTTGLIQGVKPTSIQKCRTCSFIVCLNSTSASLTRWLKQLV